HHSRDCMDVETDPAKPSPASLFDFVCLKILEVSIGGDQRTYKGRDSHQMAQITHEGIDHDLLLRRLFNITFQPTPRRAHGTLRDTSSGFCPLRRFLFPDKSRSLRRILTSESQPVRAHCNKPSVRSHRCLPA